MKCSFFRWRLSRALNIERHPGNAAQRHMEHCRECRRFYTVQSQLQRSLRHGHAAAPADIHAAVMSAVGRDKSNNELIAYNRYRSRLSYASAVLAALLLIVALSGGMHWHRRFRIRRSMRQLQQNNERLILAARAFPAILTDPLPQELRHLSTDARRAAEYIILQTPRLRLTAVAGE